MPHRPAITAADVLWASARRQPDRPCVTDLGDDRGPSTLSYAELIERVARVAGGFHRLGLRPGDRVALLLRNSHAYIQAYLG